MELIKIISKDGFYKLVIDYGTFECDIHYFKTEEAAIKLFKKLFYKYVPEKDYELALKNKKFIIRSVVLDSDEVYQDNSISGVYIDKMDFDDDEHYRKSAAGNGRKSFYNIVLIDEFYCISSYNYKDAINLDKKFYELFKKYASPEQDFNLALKESKFSNDEGVHVFISKHYFED